jgi:hypothetical protein
MRNLARTKIIALAWQALSLWAHPVACAGELDGFDRHAAQKDGILSNTFCENPADTLLDEIPARASYDDYWPSGMAQIPKNKADCRRLP